jgi:hypothetical protein
MLRWDVAHQMWVDRSFTPLNRQLANSKSARDNYVGESGANRRLGRAVDLRKLPQRKYDTTRRQRKHLGPYLPIVVQACRENEYSYEYKHGVVAHGAFTFALAKNLRSAGTAGRVPSFNQLVKATARELELLGYMQHPAVIGPSTKLRSQIPWCGDPRQRKRG